MDIRLTGLYGWVYRDGNVAACYHGVIFGLIQQENNRLLLKLTRDSQLVELGSQLECVPAGEDGCYRCTFDGGYFVTSLRKPAEQN